MATSFSQVRQFLVESETFFFESEERNVFMLLCKNRETAQVVHVVLRVDPEGESIALRSAGLAAAPPDHPKLSRLHDVMAKANFQTLLVRMAWQPRDGEVIASADLWLEDADLTPRQLHRVLDNFMSVAMEAKSMLLDELARPESLADEEVSALASLLAGHD